MDEGAYDESRCRLCPCPLPMLAIPASIPLGLERSIGQREFIIVDGWTPGLYCHHVFYLVEVYADGKAVASDQFGACHELQGATRRGGRLLISLSDPYIPGKRASGPTSFEWKNGGIVEVSGDGSAEPSRTCAAANHAAQVTGSSMDPDHRAYQVSGKTRLQFFSAPDLRCEQPGVFVIAGDAVTADKRFGAYTFVHYVSRGNGSSAQGWVLSKRLVAASALQPD